MKLIFIGADHEVTGSCHYLAGAEKNIFWWIMVWSRASMPLRMQPLPVCEAKMDYVLLTHAHVDHSGTAAAAVRQEDSGGRSLTTEATADLCSIMLRDCAHIQMHGCGVEEPQGEAKCRQYTHRAALYHGGCG